MKIQGFGSTLRPKLTTGDRSKKFLMTDGGLPNAKFKLT
jgi:hypothetical protein